MLKRNVQNFLNESHPDSTFRMKGDRTSSADKSGELFSAACSSSSTDVPWVDVEGFGQTSDFFREPTSLGIFPAGAIFFGTATQLLLRTPSIGLGNRDRDGPTISRIL
jgi:hypothetical protein